MAGDEGHVWRSLFDQEDDRGKVVMLLKKRVSGVSGGLHAEGSGEGHMSFF